MIVIRPARTNVETIAPTTFQIGRTYSVRSSCDYDSIMRFTVIKRTAKFITIRDESFPHEAPKRVGVRMWNGRETASPLGRYSMSPVIYADRELS